MKLHQQRGVAAVELALIMVPMLILCFGIVEVGRALYYYDGLVKATRGAARYLTVKNLNPLTSGIPNGSNSTNPDVQKAIALAVCGKTTCTTGDQLVPGLNATKVTVTTNNNVLTGVGTVSLVSVNIASVNFTSLLPYGIASFTFSPVKTTMAWSTT